ncbi:glutathione S-transferase family protein [Yoonia sp. 2307UL14-13]|uniref:glutathione S-transferase family protein n=1 Tax=Yoonia sp. 2307UL14-13 TaxID=3126506 RepID=UPI0030991807
MITLITYQAGFGQLSFSPFCVKAMWLLQAADVEWKRDDCNDPRKYPKAKLPAIKDNGQIIGDSHSIQAHLESKGADFWGRADPAARAMGHALIRMAEEHIYFHILLDRWGNEKIWPIIREEYFAAIPALLRRPITGAIRKSTLKGMHAQGLGRFTPEERLRRIEPDLQAIHHVLGDDPFLLGDEPRLPDYSVAAMLGAIIASPLPTGLSERVANDPKLADYAKRVADRMAP